MRPTKLGRLLRGVVFVCAALCVLSCRTPAAPDRAESLLPETTNAVTYEEDERAALRVKEAVLRYLGRGGKAVPAKETVGAMAAVVGERCLDAAGEVSVRGHKFVVGQRIFSDRVNFLMTGDNPDGDFLTISGRTIFGAIRDQLAGSRYRREHFPRLESIFAGFASRIGDPKDWGKVPLSLPAEQWPERLPLRVAFDTRADVDAALGEPRGDKARALNVCTLALVLMLSDAKLTRDLEPAAALALTFETINGMAKTAPMTDKAVDEPTPAMREAQRQVIRVERR